MRHRRGRLSLFGETTKSERKVSRQGAKKNTQAAHRAQQLCVFFLFAALRKTL